MIFYFIPLIAQTPPLDEPGLSFGWMFVKTLVAMAVVIALAILFIRYILPRLQGIQTRGRSSIRIVDRQMLDQRRALYVVRVGKKIILLGTSEQGVSKITDLDEEDINEV